MDTKRLKSRRKTPETSLQPPSTNAEGLKNCNGNNENFPVIDNCDPTLAKNTTTDLLQPTLKKDRKFPKNKLVTSVPETAPIKKEVITIGNFCNNLNSLNLSSIDSKSTDTFQQKRPLKLAPLELPAQVKEAQMKKITTMVDKVYVNESKPSQRNSNTPYHCPTKNDPLKKIGTRENKLPRLTEDVVSTKDKILSKDSSVRTNSLPRNLRLGNSKMMTAESRHVNESLPKTISSKTNGSQNTFVQRQFRSNTNHVSREAVPINGPAGDYVEMKTTGKLEN